MHRKLRVGDNQFIYDDQTGNIYKVHPGNVLEKLILTDEQLSRLRPYLYEENQKMSTYREIINKLREGETVYLLNEFYHTAIKCVPGTTSYRAKHKGDSEYEIHSGTDLVYETLTTEGREITEQEFNEY